MYTTLLRKAILATTLITTTLSSPTPPQSPYTNNTKTPYKLVSDLSSTSFFSAFDFYTGPDPTHGFVQYLDHSAAVSRNLVGMYNDTGSIYLGVDSTSKDPAGRASVRLESKKSWNKGLLIADIAHMPSSECGVWGAYWLLSNSSEWPNGGEIDIAEGVNDQVHNAVTLHTAKGCVVDNSTLTAGAPGDVGLSSPLSTPFSGTVTTDDCDVNAPGQGKNVGCSIAAPETHSDVQMGAINGAPTPFPSFGTPFNDAEGGVYAMEWTSSSISVWFIPRYSPLYNTHFSSSTNNTKANSTTAANSTSTVAPDPSQWGAPIAHFAGKGCDFEQRFKDLKIIFNIDFCGDWAGKEWDKSCRKKTGVETCEAYVRDNPEKFADVYWEIDSLKWYQRG